MTSPEIHEATTTTLEWSNGWPLPASVFVLFITQGLLVS